VAVDVVVAVVGAVVGAVDDGFEKLVVSLERYR